MKNPISVELGIGPVCRSTKGIEIDDKQGELDFMVEAIPNFGDVICRRENGEIYTNVPRRIIRHSPDGFEWGYAGSGPADFAFNILSCYIGEDSAKSGGLYQAFKFKFVSNLPKEGGTIKKADVMKWLDEVKQYREKEAV
ncbi:MAG: DUF6166 domain-containing protein [Treponema sp.]|nr:DUF6166 domain-containing protein [Treponema sp.]